jgi:hypothetical protein
MASPIFGKSPNDERLTSRYKIIQQLGKKAGRRTLLARDLQTQQPVVIKVLLFGNDFEWDDLKLFEREAQTLQALSYPSIPRYLNYFELNSPKGKGFALVQTYIKALSLEQHLKAGRTFTEAEVIQLGKALLEILIYLHKRQPPVIHRDIKPSNVLLTNHSGNSIGQVYLVDFGSVQTVAKREGGTFTVVGTYGYMPPEQFGGRATVASDLYSLGATLIYLVTGTHPADLPQEDLRIQFEQLVNLSPSFIDWLKWMTEPTLSRRLSSAQKALQALEHEQLRDSTSIVVRKPKGSKVILTQTPEFLEIVFPPVGFSLSVCIFCIPAIIFQVMVIMMIILSKGAIFYSFLFIVCIYFWIFGLVILLLVLFEVFGKVRLDINQQQISLTYELFGLKHSKPCPSQRQDIWKLEHSQKACKFWLDIIPIDKPQKLSVYAGKQEYVIHIKNLSNRKGYTSQMNGLTDSEVNWLAYELSNWLCLPIRRT